MKEQVRLLKFRNVALFITSENGNVKTVGVPSINFELSPDEAELMASALEWYAIQARAKNFEG